MRTLDFWCLDTFLDTAVKMRVMSMGSAAVVLYGFADVL